MKFKKIVILTIGILIELLIHWWICKTSIVVKNYGVSFSVDWVNALLLNAIFILIVGWFYFKEKSYFLVLILVGGLTNVVDRLVFGYVRDYWNFVGILTNNLNDWLIGIGVLLFLIEMVWKKQK